MEEHKPQEPRAVVLRLNNKAQSCMIVPTHYENFDVNAAKRTSSPLSEHPLFLKLFHKNFETEGHIKQTAPVFCKGEKTSFMKTGEGVWRL